jgi:hypothetical protein
MPYLLIKVASLILYIALLVRLYLHYGPRLSLSACIHFFIKLALLTIYVVVISHSIYGLGYVFLDLRM